MAHPSSATERIATQVDVPATPVAKITSTPVVQVPVSSPAVQPTTQQSEDLYDYDKCTIVVVMQFRPKRDTGRSVLLSVQNGTANREELPLYRLLPSEDELGGPLPPTLTALLQALQQDLPARKQRHDQRAAQKAVPAPRPAAKDASKRVVPANAAASKPAPPTPAATKPLPKEGLVLSRLFDDL